MGLFFVCFGSWVFVCELLGLRVAVTFGFVYLGFGYALVDVCFQLVLFGLAGVVSGFFVFASGYFAIVWVWLVSCFPKGAYLHNEFLFCTCLDVSLCV